MRCKVLALVASSALLFPVLLLGQMKNDTQVNMARALTKPKIENVVSLLGLDPSKFSMNHSYSFSAGTTGGESFNMGLYLNTMKYRLSGPLTLHLQLGIQHSPLGQRSDLRTSGSDVFVSSAGMEFKPSDNLKLQLQFSQRPNAYYFYNPAFQDPISRNRAWFDNKDEKQQDEQ